VEYQVTPACLRVLHAAFVRACRLKDLDPPSEREFTALLQATPNWLPTEDRFISVYDIVASCLQAYAAWRAN
jgi:hypothetical protein